MPSALTDKALRISFSSLPPQNPKTPKPQNPSHNEENLKYINFKR
jgi:hypothetical protein